MGRGTPGQARSIQPASAGHRGRADQPGSVDVVSEAHRWRALPDCGHLVADGDRPHHDHALARHRGHQAGVGDAALPRHRGGRLRRGRQSGASRRRRLPGAYPALARHAADPLRRSRALPGGLLEPLSKRLLRRRRREAGQGRLLLDPGPRGRRDERLRPPAEHDGSRKRVGGSSQRGGGRCDRQDGRNSRAGAVRLRHRARRSGTHRRTGGGTEGARG